MRQEIDNNIGLAYKLDNIRCNLLDYCDDNPKLENQVLYMQKIVLELINNSWNLYNKYYGDYKVK